MADDSSESRTICPNCRSSNAHLSFLMHSYDIASTDDGLFQFIRCDDCSKEELLATDDILSASNASPSPLIPDDVDQNSEGYISGNWCGQISLDTGDNCGQTHAQNMEMSISKKRALLREDSSGSISAMPVDEACEEANLCELSSSLSTQTLNDQVIWSDLDRLAEALSQQPCSNCNTGRLEPLHGIRHVYSCINCQQLCGFDDSMNYFELLNFLLCGSADYLIEPCPVCGNCNPNEFTLQRGSSENSEDDEGIRCVLQCMVCKLAEENQNLMNVQDESDSTHIPADYAADYSDSSGIPSSGDGSNIGRTQIKDVSMLKEGDHIAWHQNLAYWHHALVIEVPKLPQNWVNVIHYNGPNWPTKGEILDEWFGIDLNACQLYRYDYRPQDCYPIDVAVSRARFRLGERSYSLMKNNCEHFVRWCKTGHHRSVQVESFVDTVKRRTGDVLSYGTKLLASSLKRTEALTEAVSGKTARIVLSNTNAVASSLQVAGTNMAAEEVKQITRSVAPTKLLGAALTMLIEVRAICKDIHAASRQRQAGNITRQEFIKVTIKRSCEGVGCVAGMAVVLPLPYSWVGIPLAALIGQGAGAVLGRGFGVVYDKYSDKRDGPQMS